MAPISTIILLATYLAPGLAKTNQFQAKPNLHSRSPSLCTTLDGTKCTFPFTYQEVEHYRCTNTNSPAPWCATEVHSNGTTITDKLVYGKIWPFYQMSL